MTEDLTTNDLLNAYRSGFFPMAESRESADLFWYDPPKRGQLSIDALHVPERLRRRVLDFPFAVKIDSDFRGVIEGCAAQRAKQPDTWINKTIIDLFVALHEQGHAHSVECYKDGKLAGGLYGLALGGAFFGESMFSRETDASKIALVHLCARLQAGGFMLLDTQFINEHLKQFGAFEIDRDEYRARLATALEKQGDFTRAQDEKITVAAYLKSLIK